MLTLRSDNKSRQLPGVIFSALLAVFYLCSGEASATQNDGFGFALSRVVVMQDSRGGASATVLNNSANVYLVQGRVVPADGLKGFPVEEKAAVGVKVPFVVTPPLQRVEGKSQLPLRILPVPDSTLPADRESLFFLSAKAIPLISGPAPADKGVRVVMALQQHIKLFWRPKGLTETAIFDGKVASRLVMSRAGSQLRVTNPTPYYITFSLLRVGGKDLDGTALRVMVPPKGTQDYALPAGASGGRVEWQVIDEYGLMTEKQGQTLS